MQSNRNLVFVLAIMLTLVVGIAAAQTTYEVKQGTVVHVYGNNLVVKMSDGTIREVDVQEGFMFDVDGKATPVSGLKPGTVLTATIETTGTPYVVETTEIRKGKVVRKVGQTIIVRRENGEIVKFHEVPEDIALTSDGKPVTLFDLKEGMNLTATIVSKRTEIVTDRQVEVAGTAPAARPKPAPKPAYVAPAALPATGSSLPLIGLAGLALLALGAGIAVLRRF